MPPPRLGTWKKLLFSLIVFCIVLPPVYLAAEIAFRRSQGIPVRMTSPESPKDERTLSADDTSAMDFNSIYYYEIFRPSDNRVLFYEPRRGFSKGAVSINSHGFRDREFSLDKPEGVVRIVVLGDSVIWGHGVTLESTFPKQLESLLNRKLGNHYEVLNFGVSGYSLQQEAEFYFDRAQQFHPDIVILGLCINDTQYSSVEGDFFRQRESGLFAKSYLSDALSFQVNYALRRFFNVPPRYLESTVDIAYHLNHLKQSSPEVVWMVVMFPGLTKLHDYPFQWIHETLTEPARDLGFIVHDLLQDFRQYNPRSLRVDHIHPSGFGNQIAAEAVFETMLENGVVGSQASR